MALPIFYLENYADDTFLTLSEETSKHVVQVLRMNAGEKLQLTEGKGSLLTAEIVDPHKKKCTVKITEKVFTKQKAEKICIAISLLKNASRFEWFLEKATEIGITEIVPIICNRTEKQHFRYERMRQILISAMMQSQQVWLPAFSEPVSFSKVVNSTYQTKLIAHCEDDLKRSIKEFDSLNSVQILIGPEGDFSSEEIKLALQHNFTPVTLGKTRLRTETAGIVAATILCNYG